VAQTILTLLANPTLRAECAPRFRQVAAQYHWKVCARPLIEFCAAPHFAPDKAHRHRGFLSASAGEQSPRRLLGKAWRALRIGGVSGLLQQSREYLRWKRTK
jgi:hypothetical protein